jgi:hypothetical protein
MVLDTGSREVPYQRHHIRERGVPDQEKIQEQEGHCEKIIIRLNTRKFIPSYHNPTSPEESHKPSLGDVLPRTMTS